jgi:hypothetical protein
MNQKLITHVLLCQQPGQPDKVANKRKEVNKFEVQMFLQEVFDVWQCGTSSQGFHSWG